ncbi:Homoserine kinase [Smittium culicis]|uniref:Homoserine kinase n=2 Tax=Smittium culicis TaxID=133412 RepID=A0A1R1XGF8_9FUNG|nr:Homoserine kinase [Smittium culicis]
MSLFKIRVPGTSANMGPGFDCLGVSLSTYLNLYVKMGNDHKLESDNSDSMSAGQREVLDKISLSEKVLLPKNPACAAEDQQYNCELRYLNCADNNVPLEPCQNLITQVALYVLRYYKIEKFPQMTLIVVDNSIPLSRGLGSSAAAIVSGVLLANAACNLNLSVDDIKGFCLVFECHPDNTTPAIVGGITASFVSDDENLPISEKCALHNENISALKNNVAIDLLKKVFHVNIDYNKDLKAVVAIPKFELSTHLSRSVLPKDYKIDSIVYNLQRIAVLISSFRKENFSHEVMYKSMKDKIHQPFRKHLVPGLSNVIDEMTYSNTPGLAGVCLSGAGPTTIAFCTENFDDIASKMKGIFDTASEGKFETEVLVLDIVEDGSVTEFY